MLPAAPPELAAGLSPAGALPAAVAAGADAPVLGELLPLLQAARTRALVKNNVRKRSDRFIDHLRCVRPTGTTCARDGQGAAKDVRMCLSPPSAAPAGSVRSLFRGPGLRPLPRSSERRRVQDQMTCVIHGETRPRLTRLSIESASQSSDSPSSGTSLSARSPPRSWPARGPARDVRSRPPPMAVPSCCPARPSASRHSLARPGHGGRPSGRACPRRAR